MVRFSPQSGGPGMNRVLILDMDGTCREPASGGQFIQHLMDQRVISGADTALARYHAEGWLIFGATNQGGVAAGKKTLYDCNKEQVYTLELLPQIHEIYFCPDFEGKQLGYVSRNHCSWSSPGGFPSFRKPGTGMIKYILALHRADQCLFVGDREEDQLAAAGAGIPFMWADAWRADSQSNSVYTDSADR